MIVHALPLNVARGESTEAGSVSVTTTAWATDGPLLTTASCQVIASPGAADAGAVLVMLRRRWCRPAR